MDLNLILNILIVVEIIGIEFTAIWNLSQRKHRFPIVLGVYTSISVILLLFMCFVAVHLSGYGNGNGRFMLLGVFYFIPAMLNFGGEWKNKIIIAFYSFSYGLAVFAISIRFGYLFGLSSLSLAVIIIQTLLYVFTFPSFLKFSKKQVVLYIQKATRYQKNMMIRYTITSFLLIVVYNNTMVMDSSMLKKLLVYLLLIYFIILTYRLLVSYLKADDDKQELNELARVDRLTRLGNRLALKEYLEKLILKNEVFYLLFLDLNNFKSINDHYGHSVGDEYLRKFADALKKCVEDEEACFRLSGDEFICIVKDKSYCHKISGIEVQGLGEVVFLGVSVGAAEFPKEGRTIRELIELADERMYKEKVKL